MNSSQPQDFPWQTVYDERLGLGGDVAWMEAHIHDKSPGYAEGRVAGLEAANGALLTVLNFWRGAVQSADMQALLADVKRVYDFNKAEADSINTSGADA